MDAKNIQPGFRYFGRVIFLGLLTPLVVQSILFLSSGHLLPSIVLVFISRDRPEAENVFNVTKAKCRICL